MDLDSIEAMNEIRPSVYRAAMKLLSLQRLCHMDTVFIRHITASFCTVGRASQQDVLMNREEVTRTLNRMFHRVSQEVPGYATVAAPEEACSVMMRLFNNGSQTGSVSAHSLQIVLIALSADNLMDKYTSLLSVSRTGTGSISRCGLRSLLQDLSQLPAAVQEEGVFGGVEAAVRSCFNGVLTPAVKEEHVLAWLQGGPRLLLWLPTLYRLSVSQKVSHAVRCHTCKTFPITGLRYRCMKCVSIHVCQSCFLTNRQTRKHKSHHPVLEFCTQPTWRESLSSLVRRARLALLPRRSTRREADGRRVLMWEEPGETQDGVPPPSDASTRLAAAQSSDAPRDASPPASSPPSRSSSFKAPQTAEQQQAAGALLTEVRDLQRDKWLLEQHLQAWQLHVQSDQDLLGDRCSQMEVAVETLRQNNVQLQDRLAQALSRMEAQRDDPSDSVTSEDMETPESGRDTQGEEEEEEEEEEEDGELLKEMHEGKTSETPPPTIHRASTLSPSPCLHQPAGQQNGPEGAELEEDGPCPSEVDKDCPEELLQQTVDRLRTGMEDGRRTDGPTDETRRTELLESAEQVGDVIHHLVDALRTV